ncbi:MAG: mercury methylation corrinoid protein HgcA [Thermodesulfobacteriota bacterium]|nr:MAG: mercury methylation corrinoid protein HgcA [Thermodesulfobacteriota bacterium]
MGFPGFNQPFVVGSVQTPAGEVPQVSTLLNWADHVGTFKARCAVGRMHYTVDPGLYALGNPDQHSPVLVTANYKMSFDKLRQALPSKNVWILVLDTNGINVWCAAGAGTFGTTELVNRIESTRLPQVVSHRQLILPQLAAPGVAAHRVKELSGFKVTYGPIKAEDLPAFIEAGLKATSEMRRKSFTIWERAVLIPVELVTFPKSAIIIALSLMFLIGGMGGSGGFLVSAFNHGIFTIMIFLAAVLSGTVFTPLLLPWLPGRAFSLKGMSMGIITVTLLLLFRWDNMVSKGEHIEMLSWIFLIPALSAYLGMNFTGASTYTSLSGVKKEIRWALPLEIGAGVIGLSIWIGSHFIV